MSTADENFFFGTGAGQIGLSILRIGIPDGNDDIGTCFSISSSCASNYTADIKAMNAAGGRVYASPWSPPASYKTNGDTSCTGGSGNGTLISTDYSAYATYLSNFVQSVKTYDGVNVFAISLQNEPSICPSYDGATYSASQLASLVEDVGATFASSGLTTLIFMPESPGQYDLASLGNTCMNDSSCAQYVGGNNWHDYDATYTSPATVSNATNPWASQGKKYWETEVSTLGDSIGPDAPGCADTGADSAWCPGIADAMMWAAIIDHRFAIDNANAWLYWWLITPQKDNQGLMNPSGSPTVATRAYVMGNYSKFVRPGWVRIDATHVPTTGVTVSAYKDPSGTGNFAIVATNYNSSNATVSFSLDNFSATSVTPWLTSASSNLTAQSSIAVSGDSFSATLPAQSVTTFVAGSIAPPTNVKAVPH